MTSKRAQRRLKDAKKFIEQAITEDLLFPDVPENESEDYVKGYKDSNMQIYKNLHDILRIFESDVTDKQ